MKRKLLSLFLAAVLTLLLAAAYTSPAFASEDEPFSHNIEYAVEDARVTATPVKDSAYSEDANSYAPDSAIIDLVTETLTLPEGFTAAAFSTDGGSKWKAGAPPAALTKLLNKDLTLHLSSLGIDKATKKPIAGKAASADDPAVPGATIIAFAKIAGRPKDGKLAVNYLPYADNNALTPGQWTLTPKGSTTAADVSGLQIAVAASNKKDPDEFGWGTFKSEQGINVRSTGAGQKPVKTVYLIRSAPKGGSNAQAASKPYKVTASGQLAQPKLKANYKDETLKPKAGMSLSGTGITTVIYAKGAPELKGVSFSTAIDPPVDPNPPGDPDPPEVPDPPVDPGTDDDSGAGTLGAEASGAEEAAEATVKAWMNATAKKPASRVQEIKLAPRAPLPGAAEAISAPGGKLKLDTKKYEVLNAGGKWGGAPKMDVSVKLIPAVRLKATAKANKDGTGYSGVSASVNGSITVHWGKDTKGGDAILAAWFCAPGVEAPEAPDIIIEVPDESDSPVITGQPEGFTMIQYAADRQLTVTATGSGTLSYQWYRNGGLIADPDTTSGGHTGATTATLTIPKNMAPGEYSYYVRVTNTESGKNAKSLVSSTVTVKVTEGSVPPVIDTHPQDKTLNKGTNDSLTVVVSLTGGGTLSYQWYKCNDTQGNNMQSISGQTGASFTIVTADLEAGEYYYLVRVTNTETGKAPASVDSTVATVTVTSTSP